MNATQRLTSDISGYCGLDESGARNDFYYECKTYEEKLSFLEDCVKYGDGYFRSYIPAIIEFLDTDFNNSNDKYHSFKSL